MRDSGLTFGGEALEVKGLARTDADRGESRPDASVFSRGRDEGEGSFEILVEVCLDPRTGGRDEIDFRRRWRRWLVEECGERLHLVPRLHSFHVPHVPGIKEQLSKT